MIILMDYEILFSIQYGAGAVYEHIDEYINEQTKRRNGKQ